MFGAYEVMMTRTSQFEASGLWLTAQGERSEPDDRPGSSGLDRCANPGCAHRAADAS
jgi:hypothetical protein